MTSTLYFMAQRGVDLAAKDFGDTSDPFLIYGLVDSQGEWIEKKKTKVQRKTLEPFWWESETFEVPDNATALKVECWDWDAIGSNDFMGQAILQLKDLKVSDLIRELVLELQNRGKPKEKVSGSIFANYCYQTAEYKKQLAAEEAAREAEEVNLVRMSKGFGMSVLTLDKVKEAASAFTLHAKEGKITNPEALEEFLIRMNMQNQVYAALGIEKGQKISDITFVKAMSDAENADMRRQSLWRIFDSNHDGNITWAEALHALALLAYDVDPKKKAEMQFELFDLDSNGVLTFSEVRMHMQRAFNISSNLLRNQLPFELRRDKDVRKALTDDEMDALAKKMAFALENADLGRQFATSLYSAAGKQTTEKISKQEYIQFAAEKEGEIKQIKIAIAMRMAETITDTAQRHILHLVSRKIR